MTHSAPGFRRGRRTVGPRAGALALITLALAGCSKHPSAPKIAGPTKFVVFSSDRGRAAGNYRTWITYLDGSGTSGFFLGSSGTYLDEHPSLSQDGVLLCYQYSPGHGGSKDVQIYNRSNAVTLDDPNVNTTADETEPYISLDGTRLLFVRDTTISAVSVKRIRLYDLTGHRFIPLPGLEAGAGTNDWSPAMDAHGRRIVFVSDRAGNPDVMLYQVPTATLLNPPEMASAADDIEPAISGDGHVVAWSSNRSGGAGGYDLYMYDVNALNALAVPSNSSGDERHPTLSNDGAYLILSSNVARPGAQGGYDLWNLNLANGVVSQVSGESSSADDVEPVVIWP